MEKIENNQIAIDAQITPDGKVLLDQKQLASITGGVKLKEPIVVKLIIATATYGVALGAANPQINRVAQSSVIGSPISGNLPGAVVSQSTHDEDSNK